MIVLFWILAGLYAFNLLASSMRRYFFYLIQEDIFDDMEDNEYIRWGGIIFSSLVFGPISIITAVVFLMVEKIPIEWGYYQPPKEID